MNKLNITPAIWLLCILGTVVFLAFVYIPFISTPEPVKDGLVATDGLIPTNVVEYTFDDLLDATEWVESKGDPNAVGDYIRRPEWEKEWNIPITEAGEYQAVGAYQIHKIYVDDVNRILGENKYTYADRWNRDLSREMTEIYTKHYASSYLTLNKMHFYEYCARIHNGGPNGWRKESTKKYWLKVKARLKTAAMN